ncbi:NAD(P)H-hydrate epimerase [Oceanobacillus rekensis]|uniref:NAD(P)H-hydrate epimerase n=1 Tax=Oceanobacillus rekensis TaxID=937927 RepID=UPI002481E969|nr:NAD(P)H-hydrate epimerase [Oceanobacillus rekensis]
MYIVTAKEMYDIDHYTMHEIGMDGKLLMENAGRAVSDKVIQVVGAKNRISIFVGSGINGGDGFVIARTLVEKGYQVQVIQVVSDEKIKGDALYHKQLFINCDGRAISEIQWSTIREIVDQSDIVIDAMLGIGVKGDLRKPILEIVAIINQSDVCVISVDIPSGLPADEEATPFTSIVADYTFIIGAAKQSAFLEKTAAYYGKWEVLEIGFPRPVFQKYAECQLWTEREFRKTLPLRSINAHKGNHGRGLIIGGNAEMPGTISMASRAAVKSGAGLITVGTIDKVITMIATSCPEAMYLKLDEKDGYLTKNPTLKMETYDAIAFGVGMGRKEETAELVRSIIQKAHCPIIIDADGLYHLKKI